MTCRRKYGIAILSSFIALSVLFFSAANAEPIPVRLRYLFGFNAKTSGAPLGWVDRILVDDDRSEVYLLDNGNKRIVITDTDGVFLYAFNHADAGIKDTPRDIALDPQKGDIYIAEAKRIVVASYRGMFKRVVDLSNIPDSKKLDIQSIFITSVNLSASAQAGENLIYIGDGGKQRVVVISTDGKFIHEFGKKEGIENNVKSLYVNEKGITFVDPAAFGVFHFSPEGKFQSRFGAVSSLFGGFSMPVGMAVDDKKERILVVDTNRMMVIVFDWNGAPLFEFGGPNMFLWPRSVAVSSKYGRIYVADNTGIIRVFEAIEEPPQPVAEAKPEPAPPPPAPEPPKDEVSKMVEEEQRLLPVFFAVDSWKLKEADKAILNKDTEWLKKNPKVKINVRGYADERGSDAYNLNLSGKRAKAVMDYLIKQGVDHERLKFAGFGRVISTDKSEEAMRRNRRVDFLVVKTIEPAAE
ncbi:MAG: OmpA family protein [Deltaproteobacteria bacterium]|nr:OmpA family protein [Deltaproteobacteria bacterium]